MSCRRPIYYVWLLLASFTLLVGVRFVSAAADEPLEYKVKAAFLLNFTKFVEWPATAFADANASMSICILGEDPFGGTLEEIIAGESVGGRRLTVQRIRRTPPPRSCQVLFISSSEKGLGRTLAELSPEVLTVGEGDAFLRDGGMIAFLIDNRRVRFSIDEALAEKNGLKISSKLLSVAKAVKR